ncbi:MAG: FAD-binding oxidoreductase, partial [Chloroflexi bacterium]|nr:FAD-binding oxidoreductase [Chloroflexota bacterium]
MTSAPVCRPRVCVIGAGVMGLSAAWQLALRGVDVLVVDRREPGAEASAANAGTLAVQNKKTATIPLVMHALGMWERMNDALGIDIEYERRGGFRVAHNDEDVAKLEETAAAQRHVGARVEVLHQPHLAREAPYLSPVVRAAAWCADDGMANPLAYVRGLLRTCRRLRVAIWSGAEVTAIVPRGPREFNVETDRGTIRCAEVLVAAGAWNAALVRLVGLELPVTTQIQQALVTDDVPFFLPHVVTHVRGNLTVKQQRPGRLLIGGAWPGDG